MTQISTTYRCSEKPTLSRRSFMRVGTAGLAGLSLANALRQGTRAWAGETSPPAKNVIMIFLSGGPATIDMWDMKPDAPVDIRGEFRPSETSVAGVKICDLMPNLAAKMHLLTLVRSLAHTIAEHGQGATYLMTGNRPSPAREYPSLGSLSARLLPTASGMPLYATISAVPSAGAGDFGASADPFEISGLASRGENRKASDRFGLPAGFTIDDLKRREGIRVKLDERMRQREGSELPRELDRFQQQAIDILLSDKMNKALNLSQEKSTTREQYGASSLGHHLLSARRLIEAGARFVTVGYGDWDTHSDNFSRLRTTLLPELDRGLAGLLSDLEQRGLLHETIVYCTGEFGRTPSVNSTAGRDHWARSMTALLAGGGVRKGSVYGATDSQGQAPTDQPCSPDDVSATIFEQLGFPAKHRVETRQGRPVPLFGDGRMLTGVIG
jgi:hypothetical protein